jgi:hypothetical protein
LPDDTVHELRHEVGEAEIAEYLQEKN